MASGDLIFLLRPESFLRFSCDRVIDSTCARARRRAGGWQGRTAIGVAREQPCALRRAAIRHGLPVLCARHRDPGSGRHAAMHVHGEGRRHVCGRRLLRVPRRVERQGGPRAPGARSGPFATPSWGRGKAPRIRCDACGAATSRAVASPRRRRPGRRVVVVAGSPRERRRQSQAGSCSTSARTRRGRRRASAVSI